MIITRDGSYSLKNNVKGRGASQTILYLSGVTGGAVIALHYKNGLGDLIPLTDGVMEVPQQYVIYDGSMVEMYAVVTSASATTNIDVIVAGAG